MNTSRFKKSASRAAIVPIAFGLGAVTVLGVRGNNAGSQQNHPPVQPPVQALSMQTAFEQVAVKLRPSVVFIRSRQTLKTAAFRGMPQQSDDQGNGDAVPFPFFRDPQGGGQGQGGRQFRMQPPGYTQRAEASGSGVIIRANGYILTNDHVVAGADRVTVRLQDGREYVGKVMRDFRSDLALIKIDADNLPAAELADSDKVDVGQWAIAFGAPFGLSDTMTHGVISSLHRQEAIGSGSDERFYSSLLQTDASINPGNSGGPLVDLYGRVVGINVAIESPSGTSAGIGFAIPSNTARYIADSLMATGSVTRGYLGLAPAALTYDYQQRYGVKEGALVTSVVDGTPAAKAGLQVEDVIVRFDGKAVKDDAAFRDLVSRTAPGTTVPVEVRRGGGQQTLQVTVGTNAEAPLAKADAAVQPQANRGKLGVQILDADKLDDAMRQQLNLKGDLKSGAVIVNVQPGSPAAEAGIRPGDVITRLNGKAVANGEQLKQIASGFTSGGNVTAVIRRGSQTVLAQIAIE
jgi:serine protease Do